MNKTGLKETAVGVFVLVGLVVAAGMILYLGRDNDRKYRETVFSVSFPNAGGIIKGSKVLMAGVPIGKVIDNPKVAFDGNSASMRVGLMEGYQITKDSTFLIKDAGVLGDKFIDAVPNTNTTELIKDGAEIEGQRTQSLGELADRGGQVMDSTQNAIEQIKKSFESTDKILSRVNTEVLDTNTIAELKQSIHNLNTSLQKADAAFTKVNDQILDEKTVASVKGSLLRFDSVVTKLEKFADTADGVAKHVDVVVTKIEKGEGLTGRLVSDKQLADDIKALISNLRRRGVLFYKDDAGESGKPGARDASSGVRGGR